MKDEAAKPRWGGGRESFSLAAGNFPVSFAMLDDVAVFDRSQQSMY